MSQLVKTRETWVRETCFRSLSACAIMVAILCSVPVTAEADQFSTLAKRLAELRAEVETLSGELSSKSTDYQDRLRSYARQKADLELEQRRNETALEKLTLAIEEKRAEIEKKNVAGTELTPLFTRSVEGVRAYVGSTLPFKTKDRLAELDKLVERQSSGLLTAQQGLMRLWSFVEDELRMTRESVLVRQTIRINGEDRLADVVRVGMVMLFFKTSDDRVGYVEKQGDGWSYREVVQPDEVKQVSTLFDQFKKRIRVGYFELPNALIAEGSK